MPDLTIHMPAIIASALRDAHIAATVEERETAVTVDIVTGRPGRPPRVNVLDTGTCWRVSAGLGIDPRNTFTAAETAAAVVDIARAVLAQLEG